MGPKMDEWSVDHWAVKKAWPSVALQAEWKVARLGEKLVATMAAQMAALTVLLKVGEKVADWVEQKV